MRKVIVSFFILSVSVMISGQIPDVSLRDIEGKKVNLKTFCTEGSPTIISFFATWCKPCMRELKAISEVYDDWQEETNVRLVAISIDQAQDIEKVKPLVDGNNWDYTVLLDTEGELKRQMNVQSVPFMLIVDGSGKIVEQRSGYTDGEEKNVYKVLKDLKK